MAKLVIDTNEHLKDEKARFEAIFRSVYTSFEIEGIKIPIEEAKKIAEEVRKARAGWENQFRSAVPEIKEPENDLPYIPNDFDGTEWAW